MRNWWIKFGCFLTGYNYSIVSNSSEIAAKAVKRYTSAMIIVCIIWAFIGYVFTQRYLHGGPWGSLAGGVLLVIIIIQIERQIILSINPSVWLYISRGIIAMMMAIIGAIIIDQIIFKEDIELEKINSINKRVNDALPGKTAENKRQIDALDSAIVKKENERLQLITDIEKNPTIKSVSSSETPVKVQRTTTKPDGTLSTSEEVKKSTTISISNLPNPKQTLIAPLEQDITNLRKQKSEMEKALLNTRDQLEKDISSRVGFLDELEVMYNLIKRSNVAMVVWFIWFFFLLGLEMLVLISKVNEKENDYEKTVKHQMELQIRKLAAFSRAAELREPM